jgi:hypothetical protein
VRAAAAGAEDGGAAGGSHTNLQNALVHVQNLANFLDGGGGARKLTIDRLRTMASHRLVTRHHHGGGAPAHLGGRHYTGGGAVGVSGSSAGFAGGAGVSHAGASQHGALGGGGASGHSSFRGGAGAGAGGAGAGAGGGLSSSRELAWLAKKEDAELDSMRVQSSTWLFVESFRIGSINVNVTLALSTNFVAVHLVQQYLFQQRTPQEGQAVSAAEVGTLGGGGGSAPGGGGGGVGRRAWLLLG